MGMLDVENFTAIINPGERAILAVASTRPTPVVRDGQVAVRSMMKMTLSADHRIVDGTAAAGFVNAVRRNSRSRVMEAAGLNGRGPAGRGGIRGWNV